MERPLKLQFMQFYSLMQSIIVRILLIAKSCLTTNNPKELAQVPFIPSLLGNKGHNFSLESGSKDVRMEHLGTRRLNMDPQSGLLIPCWSDGHILAT